MSSSTAVPGPQAPAPVRRVVTGHTPNGHATFVADEAVKPMSLFPGSQSGFYTIHCAAERPVKVDQEMLDAGHVDSSTSFPGFGIAEGAVFRVVDYPPGSKSPVHRTDTIDYGTVIYGSVELELDDGKRTTLCAGDTFVQRGTNHFWDNPSESEWARVSFVTLAAVPPVVGGKPLEDTIQAKFHLMPRD